MLYGAINAPADNAGIWLHTVAQLLRTTLSGTGGSCAPSFDVRLACVTTCADQPRLASLGTTADWSTRPRTEPSLPISLLESGLLLAARQDWADLIAASVTCEGGPRSCLLPDAAWEHHPLRQARSGIGLDEFIAHSTRIGSAPEQALFTLQLDRYAGLEWNQDRFAAIARSLCPLLARAFDDRVWKVARRHRAMLSRLSPAQREILPLLVRGLSETEIARELARSRFTIHDHVKSIYTILHVRSRRALCEKWHGIGAHAAPALASAPRMG